MDMKAAGSYASFGGPSHPPLLVATYRCSCRYVARSLSYHGAEFHVLQADLSAPQVGAQSRRKCGQPCNGPVPSIPHE